MATETLTVKILDRDFQVACPEEERAALLESARYLDEQMRGIRKGGKVIGLERIAVMAALNITYEMLQQTERADEGSNSIDQEIKRLVSKVDDTVNRYRQMEI